MTSVRMPSLSAPALFRAPSDGASQPEAPTTGWPGLRAVPDGYVPLRIRARRRRRLMIFAVAMAAILVLGVAASHAALISGQLHLQELEEQVADQQGRYQRLRLQVARLESPERIVSAAQQRLGMVPPPGITYLSPTGPATVEPEAPIEAEAPARVAGGGWAAVKPYTVPVGR